MAKWLDLLGSTVARIQIGIAGVSLKNSSGNLLVRNAADSADASITASTLNNSGDSLVINSDSVGSGADWQVVLARPTSGMSANTRFQFPPTNGTASFVLQTDGSGNTSWVANAGSTNQVTTDTTNLAFGTASPLTLFTLPANAVVETVRVIIDTAFNGTPSLSVGISGTTSKYMGTSQVDLTATAQTVFEAYPGRTSVGTTEALIATYAAGGASAGAARIEIDYAIPS